MMQKGIVEGGVKHHNPQKDIIPIKYIKKTSHVVNQIKTVRTVTFNNLISELKKTF
jgi:hypothetical protein